KFATADDLQRMEMLRAGFAKIKDPLQQAQIAAQLFGSEWRTQLKIYTQSSQEMQDADKALIASNRQLTDAERKNLTDYTAAQGDLRKALDATRDKIGAIFAPGKTRTAEWLTNLLDL